MFPDTKKSTLFLVGALFFALATFIGITRWIGGHGFSWLIVITGVLAGAGYYGWQYYKKEEAFTEKVQQNQRGGSGGAGGGDRPSRGF